jgi:hypothetical protein
MTMRSWFTGILTFRTRITGTGTDRFPLTTRHVQMPARHLHDAGAISVTGDAPARSARRPRYHAGAQMRESPALPAHPTATPGRTTLFLLHQLGYDALTLCDGAMGAWARDPSLPIEMD